jgi:NAD(P)H-hydrate epimerase
MKVVSGKSVREMDRIAIATGTSGLRLMESAGIGLAKIINELLQTRYAGTVDRLCIVAGHGNNGGDGFVIARLLAGFIPIEICIPCARSAYSGDARINADRIPTTASLRSVESIPSAWLRPGTLVIDAMLGTGASGPAREPYATWTQQINASGCPVVAIDLPSGLNGDTGKVNDVAIRADCTITIGAPKTGLYQGAGPAHAGIVRFVDIGLPIPESAGSPYTTPVAEEIQHRMHALAADRHKGTMGRVLVVGGCAAYRGAPILAGRAAVRAGAGLVSVALPAGIAMPPAPHALMLRPTGVDTALHHAPLSNDARNDLVNSMDSLVVGPGLGREPDALAFVRTLFATDTPLIVDADALEALEASTPAFQQSAVLTPHPGEFARLAARLELSPTGDRVTDAKMVATKTHAVVVLKGLRTVIAAPDGRISVCGRGCAALATGGTGDVLAGLLGAYLHRFPHDPWIAAQVAVWIHAAAAETSPWGDSGFSADDLPEAIASLVRTIRPTA